MPFRRFNSFTSTPAKLVIISLLLATGFVWLPAHVAQPVPNSVKLGNQSMCDDCIAAVGGW